MANSYHIGQLNSRSSYCLCPAPVDQFMFLVFRTKVIRGALTHWEWERTGGIRRCINIWNELLYLCSVIEKETHISVSTRCQGSKICVCDKNILPPSAFLGPWQWRLGWWEWRLWMLDWWNKKSREEVEKRYTILPVKDLECGMVNCEVVWEAGQGH